jgi:hypothetical protein
MAEERTPKRTVRFDLADLDISTATEEASDTGVLQTKKVKFVIELDPQATQHTPPDQYTTLLDADTSFATPLDDLPSSPLSQIEPSLTPPASTLSVLPLKVSPSAISLDAGETDAQGNVMQAISEACEKCGGKIVWATKGEWLLVCEGCGEAQ